MVRGRKQIPCLVFDNADHFSIDFQEKVFQFARSLFEQELCVVIMPITDKTSWQLSRDGALQSFENEALLLPTPSAKQVVEKRTKFVLSKLNLEHPKERETYFFGKGITVDFSDLIKFVTALQELFLNSSSAALWIGSLSNHDVRRLLEISRDMINSPHLGFDEAFKAYVIGTAVQVPDTKIRAALIRGRYDIYLPETHKYVHNILDLNSEMETTPLLGLRILQALKDAAIKHGETRSNYIAKSDLYAYLAAMNIERRPMTLWTDALLKRALVLNYDPTCVDELRAKQLEISPAGEHHLYWGSGNFDYLFAVAEIFPIRDENVFKQLNYLYKSNASDLKIIGTFLSYLLREDQMFCKVPDHESFEGQKHILNTIEATRQLCFGKSRIPGKPT